MGLLFVGFNYPSQGRGYFLRELRISTGNWLSFSRLGLAEGIRLRPVEFQSRFELTFSSFPAKEKRGVNIEDIIPKKVIIAVFNEEQALNLEDGTKIMTSSAEWPFSPYWPEGCWSWKLTLAPSWDSDGEFLPSWSDLALQRSRLKSSCFPDH